MSDRKIPTPTVISRSFTPLSKPDEKTFFNEATETADMRSSSFELHDVYFFNSRKSSSNQND